MWYRALPLLALLAGCRISDERFFLVPPHPHDQITIALVKPTDVRGDSAARRILYKDPRVTIMDFDPTAEATARAECGVGCFHYADAMCQWAHDHGADFYATVDFGIEYGETPGPCTSTTWGPNEDKHCLPTAPISQTTGGTFALRLVEVATCRTSHDMEVSASVSEAGPRSTSEPAATEHLLAALAELKPHIPDQQTIDASGHIGGTTESFAAYRDGEFIGLLAADRDRTPHALTCCFEPRRGDVLVARGRLRAFEVDPTVMVAALNIGGSRQLAAGGGLHLRELPLAGGLTVGLGGDVISVGRLQVAFGTMELGWSVRPSPSWQLSANLGAGLTSGRQLSETGEANAIGLHTMPSLRGVYRGAGSWFVGGDIGYLAVTGVRGWMESGSVARSGTGGTLLEPLDMTGPFARLFGGYAF